METLVVLGILIVLVSIFVPYLLSIRERNRRLVCDNNLRILFGALQNYAKDNNWDSFPRVRYDPSLKPDGYTVFTGADDPNPFAPDSLVQPNDVTASLWLLVRIGYVGDTKYFVCPSAGGSRDWLYDSVGRPISAKARGNFSKPENLSYSYALPFSSAPEYRLKPDLIPWDFAVLADQSPGAAAAEVAHNAPVTVLSRGNSPNHGSAGQNVVYGYGNVEFRKTPYSGAGYSTPPGDNIYTARVQRGTTRPTSMPVTAIGIIGHDVAPVSNDDSYLVPAAGEGLVMMDLPTTVPVTLPATTATRPATTRATAPATTRALPTTAATTTTRPVPATQPQ